MKIGASDSSGEIPSNGFQVEIENPEQILSDLRIPHSFLLIAKVELEDRPISGISLTNYSDGSSFRFNTTIKLRNYEDTLNVFSQLKNGILSTYTQDDNLLTINDSTGQLIALLEKGFSEIEMYGGGVPFHGGILNSSNRSEFLAWIKSYASAIEEIIKTLEKLTDNPLPASRLVIAPSLNGADWQNSNRKEVAPERVVNEFITFIGPDSYDTRISNDYMWLGRGYDKIFGNSEMESYFPGEYKGIPDLREKLIEAYLNGGLPKMKATFFEAFYRSGSGRGLSASGVLVRIIDFNELTPSEVYEPPQEVVDKLISIIQMPPINAEIAGMWRSEIRKLINNKQLNMRQKLIREYITHGLSATKAILINEFFLNTDVSFIEGIMPAIEQILKLYR